MEKPVTPHITVADQPMESELPMLKQEGFTGVINLRNPGEPDQPMDPDEEGQRVRALGMDYLHLGVGSAPLTDTLVSQFEEFLKKHAQGKVLVHCRKGSRAANMVLLHLALAQGWKPGELETRGKAMGLEVERAPLTLVENYLRAHQAAS
jgi:uncharacterized protein (TIGR01244 family)